MTLGFFVGSKDGLNVGLDGLKVVGRTDGSSVVGTIEGEYDGRFETGAYDVLRVGLNVGISPVGA